MSRSFWSMTMWRPSNRAARPSAVSSRKSRWRSGSSEKCNAVRVPLPGETVKETVKVAAVEAVEEKPVVKAKSALVPMPATASLTTTQ